MKAKYWLSIILIILFASCGGSKNSLKSLTPEEFQKLHGFKPIGVYAGLNAKLGLFYIGNELVERLIVLDKNTMGISTIGYINRISEMDYIAAPSAEFKFQIGDVLFSGKNGQLTYLSHRINNLPGGIRQLKIILQHKDNDERVLLKVHVNYEVYPNNAIIKKWLEIENLSDSAIIVENLQIERLNWLGKAQSDLKLYGYNLAQNYPIPFSGGADDPIILGFLDERGEGFILGNEAPGVLKYFDLYTLENTVSIGLSPQNSNWTAEMRVPVGETFASPKTFIILFTGDDLPKTLKDKLSHFFDQYFNVSANLRELSQYVYLMDMSPESGVPKESPMAEIKLVCIDYDWQQALLEMGDTDKVKDEISPAKEEKNAEYSLTEYNFPLLMELSRSLHDANMRFGIRVDLTTIKMESQISRHIEWAFKQVDGKDWIVDWNNEVNSLEIHPEEIPPTLRKGGNLLQKGENSFPKGGIGQSGQARIFCIASDYGAYAAQIMADLIESLDEAVGYRGDRPSVVLDYIILDMPTIGSEEKAIYGCAGYGHGHYSRGESLWKIYESIFEIADFLHQKFPDLVICLSQQTYGTKIPDFALLPHIDQFLVFSGEDNPKVDDLTNFLPRNVLLEVWDKP
jgi:hypothetical protein